MTEHPLLYLFGFLAKPKVLAAWSMLLTLALAEVGSKVYISRTEEISTAKAQLADLQKSMDKMDGKLDRNGEMILQILTEQARLRAIVEQGEKKK